MALETDYGLTADVADDLCALYEPHPAWGERTREEVANIVRNSDEVVGIRETETDSLVAAARVLTDFHRQAMVYDVIVDEAHRGQGLGRRVVEAVVAHPDLQEVNPSLHCREGLVPFYKRCGFELHDRDVAVSDGRTVTYRTMRYARD